MVLDGEDFDEQLSKRQNFEEEIVDYLEEESPKGYSESELENYFEDELGSDEDYHQFSEAVEALESRDNIEAVTPARGNPTTPGSEHYRFKE